MSPVELMRPELVEMLASLEGCGGWAEQELGPYHRAGEPARRNIVEGRPGMPLQLGVRLVDQRAVPAAGMAVEVWHCDAAGRYSGFAPPEPSVVVTAADAPRGEYLPGETFLRGRQVSDTAGMVAFDTIYPGWYPGRTVHIHVIVRAGSVVLVSQLYFPDPLSDEVLARYPYKDGAARDTTNATDTIFPTGGVPAVLHVESMPGGYRAGICLALPDSAETGGPR